jgi:hypothetical protein
LVYWWGRWCWRSWWTHLGWRERWWYDRVVACCHLESECSQCCLGSDLCFSFLVACSDIGGSFTVKMCLGKERIGVDECCVDVVSNLLCHPFVFLVHKEVDYWECPMGGDLGRRGSILFHRMK